MTGLFVGVKMLKGEAISTYGKAVSTGNKDTRDNPSNPNKDRTASPGVAPRPIGTTPRSLLSDTGICGPPMVAPRPQQSCLQQ